ncbi:MAG: methyltransferase domain-containing protein [Rhodospirillaceae bacterium]|nr:MAG: methyltransferase domain-containing protein [Rhodospirillaceae bacterium]
MADGSGYKRARRTKAPRVSMSSGNLTADRRFAYGQMLRENGDAAGAAEVIAQALELAPAWAEGRFALAETLAESGRTDAASAEYRAYLVLDPADSMGASIRLALLGSDTPPATVPEAYVRRLFDEYAPRFDKSLVDRLAYRAPEALRAAVGAIPTGRKYTATLDLGCGTGLAGAAFRSMTEWLEGVDLSPRMVGEARRKKIYDHLAVGDMSEHLRAATRHFDLVVAADVLVYVGALDDIFRAVRGKTTDDGVFAFTVQRHDGEDFMLGTEHRYRHGRNYIAACATANGFAVARLDDGVFRHEGGADVPGLLAVLRPLA